MEHAPPKCFFPETKDSSGKSIYRQELIKVPSCAVHNSQKSGEDTYAVWHLACLNNVNSCGDVVRQTIVRRHAEYDRRERGGKFLARLGREVYGRHHLGTFAVADARRMVAFLTLCARAVFFFEHMRKLLVPLRVTNLSNNFLDDNLNAELRAREKFFDGEVGDVPILGNNPDVFNYSITEKAIQGIVIVRMVFYGTQKHWVYHHPDAGPTQVNRRLPVHAKIQ